MPRGLQSAGLLLAVLEAFRLAAVDRWFGTASHGALLAREICSIDLCPHKTFREGYFPLA
jgi:hypothetical protein